MILGVVNEFPLPNEVQPEATLYQLITPALAVAPKVTVPVEHLAAGVVPAILGIAFTVAVTAVLVAVVHPIAVAST